MEYNVNRELYEKIDSSQKTLISMLENTDKVCRSLMSSKYFKGGNIVIPYEEAMSLASGLAVSVRAVALRVQSSTREDKAMWELFNRDCGEV